MPQQTRRIKQRITWLGSFGILKEKVNIVNFYSTKIGNIVERRNACIVWTPACPRFYHEVFMQLILSNLSAIWCFFGWNRLLERPFEEKNILFIFSSENKAIWWAEESFRVGRFFLSGPLWNSTGPALKLNRARSEMQPASLLWFSRSGFRIYF